MGSLSSTERTPIVIQLCLRSRIGLWEKYYYTLFTIDITIIFSSDMEFTNIVVWSMGQSGAKAKYRVITELYCARTMCTGLGKMNK